MLSLLCAALGWAPPPQPVQRQTRAAPSELATARGRRRENVGALPAREDLLRPQVQTLRGQQPAMRVMPLSGARYATEPARTLCEPRTRRR